MTAGRMDQPITIERRAMTPALGGGYDETWTTWKSVWAAVKAKSGREGMEEGRVNATFIVVFEIYTLAGLQDADRIVWQGVRYNIRGIVSGGPERLTMKVEAERGVAS
jgi:head-tail adaptor